MKSNNAQIRFSQILLGLILIGAAIRSAAEFIPVYVDEDGEGVYEETPIDPTDSNPGDTIGEQRLLAVEKGFELFNKAVYTEVDVYVDIDFMDMSDSSYAALAFTCQYWIDSSAYPEPIEMFVPDAEFIDPDIVYPCSLAEHLIDPEGAVEEAGEIYIAYSSANFELDNYELGDYSLSRSLVSEVMHEIGHVAGMVSEIYDADDGRFLNGFPSLFDTFVVVNDEGAISALANQTEADRVEAADTGILEFNGDATRAFGLSELTSGVSSNGRPRLHTYDGGEKDGQAIEHFHPDVSPEQLMASVAAATVELGMLAGVLSDLGWGDLVDIEVTMIESDDSFDILVDNPSESAYANIRVYVEHGADVTVSNIDAEPGVCTEGEDAFTCTFEEIPALDTLRILFDAETASDTPVEISAEVTVESNIVDPRPANNYASVIMRSTEVEPETEEPVEIANSDTDEGGCVAYTGPRFFSQAYAASGTAGSSNLGFVFMPFLLGAIRKVKSLKMNRILKVFIVSMLGLGLMACGSGGGSASC